MKTKSPIFACWTLTYLVGVIHRNKEDKQKKNKSKPDNQNTNTNFGFREKWEWYDIFFNHTPENAFIYACFLGIN